MSEFIPRIDELIRLISAIEARLQILERAKRFLMDELRDVKENLAGEKK